MSLSKFKKGSLVEIVSTGKTGIIIQRRYSERNNVDTGWMLDVFCNSERDGAIVQFSPKDLKLICN